MKKEFPSLQDLESKHVLSILRYLFDHGMCKKGDLYKNVSQTNTMASKLDYLERHDLIRMDYRKFENNMTLVDLTEKGRNIAKHLKLADEILQDIAPLEDDAMNCSASPEQGNTVGDMRWHH